MHVRKFRSDKSALLEMGKAIVAESADSRYVFRVTIVNLALSGMPTESISAYSGVSQSTVMDWVRKVDRSGFDALMAVKQEGRPRKLTKEQEESVRSDLEGDPSAHGYDVWDGPSLSDHIKKEYGAEMGVRACQLLMRRLGFSLIRPQTHPSLANPDETRRDEFKKN